MSNELDNRAMGELVLQIDSLREEKKRVGKDYQTRIEELETQLTQMAIDAQSTQIHLDFGTGEVKD